MKKYDFKSGTVVITGAASGIGKAMAFNIASKGGDLALLDRNPEGLKAVANELHTAYPKLRITCHTIDLSRLDGIPAVASDVIKQHRKIALLVNNAGIATSGKFDELSLEDIDLVLTINFRSHVALIKALLPSLKKVKGSHIANVSSLFGLVSPIGQSAYSASKFAVRGFSDVLRGELAEYNIGVSVIYPAGVKTNVARNSVVGAYADAKAAAAQSARFEKKFLTMTPERAAEIIVSGIKRRKPRIIVGSTAKWLDVLVRLFPGTYVNILNRSQL